MHGRQSEERQRQRHMWPVSALATVSDSPCNKFFYKDGRKISIGDCALFQAGNAPPFIGIIRYLTGDKEGHTKLGVNWLYRPADVKLGKGVLLEAAPNEVFYSFHKDEISAASLLHPCKVAFLRKGIELPSGVSSFVCRRVYDTTNKCLWWLTDQDYTNERQEEVDQLLDKTKHEMHATVQSGGPSPKSLSGSASTQQLKTSADNIQNASFPSHAKGKKRERADQNTDPVKRERSSKSDDSDAGHFKQECIVRPEEISKITDKDGSLINSEGVGQLVHLMQSDRSDDVRKGIDLALWRTMLVGVIAMTDRDDCLSKFVQLRGLPILDDWLQEAHKGKTGDTSSPKEGDKVVEELLLMLLRALDRLPVDLDALKTCNVGKSVNQLRTHKNTEIQKKARNIVDTWKKRVEAEMKNNDTKSASSQGVSWPCKQSTGEVVHAHGGRRGGSAEVVMKSTTPLMSNVKPVSNKTASGDTVVKSTSGPLGSVKVSTLLSSTISSKDSHCKLTVSSGTSDLPVTAMKEEKSTSSSQSQNNSQSCSSELGKAAGSAWKEDARSSTAGSMSAKASSSGSRHRKSSNGTLGSGMSGCPKEAGGGKLVVCSRNMTCEKAPQSGVTSNKGYDNSRGDNMSSHRLIVRLPNPGRNPAPSISGGSIDDTAAPASRGSSPSMSEKHDASDRKAKVQADISRSAALEFNTESWQSNEVKDGLTEGDDGDRLSTAIAGEELSRNGEEVGKTFEMCKSGQTTSSELRKQKESAQGLAEGETEKTGELAEFAGGATKRCTTYSETTQVHTDHGLMNLPANMASSESSKVEQVPFVGNSERSVIGTGEVSLDKDSKSMCSVDIISSHPSDDTEDKSTIDVKDVKDVTVSSDCQDASRNDLSVKTLKIDITDSHQKDVCNSSRDVECLSTADLGDTKNPLDGMGMNYFSAGLSCEHKFPGDKKEEGLPSIQEAEQHMELSCGYGGKMGELTKEGNSNLLTEMACAEPVSANKTEDEHCAAKISKSDDEGPSQPHLKATNVEGNSRSRSDVNEENTEECDLVTSHSASARILDGDVMKSTEGILAFSEERLEVTCPVAQEIKQEVLPDEKSLCTAPSDKEAQDGDSTDRITSDQVRGCDSIDAKEPPWNSGGEVEGKSRDVGAHADADNQQLPGTRSIIFADDGQETETEKGENVDTEKTVGAGEGEVIDQANHVSVCVERKSMAMGPDSGHDNCDTERRDCIDVREHSGFPSKSECPLNVTAIGIASPVSTQETQLIARSVTQCMKGSETSASGKIATESTISTNSVAGGSDTIVKLDFDLNEGLGIDEGIQDDAMTCAAAAAGVMPLSSASLTLTSNSSGLTAPIPVAATAKGPLIPPANPLRSKGELGWKGSAATSAFRPAEPRRTPERQHTNSEGLPLDAVAAGVMGNQNRPPLDIDLNVPDERGLEDGGLAVHSSSQNSVQLTSSEITPMSGHDFMPSTSDLSAPAGTTSSAGRLDLDLNRVGESEESGPVTTQIDRKTEVLGSSLETFSNCFSHGESNVPRDFDLNDGPSFEDAGDEPATRNFSGKSNGICHFPFVAGLGMNGESVKVSPRFPSGMSHSAVAIPLLSDRTENPYPVVAVGATEHILSSAPGPTFSGDLYRGLAFSSSSAISFSNTTAAAFPYAGLSFGSSFPLASTSFSGGSTSYLNSSGSACYPAIPSQLVSAGAVSSPYTRPYAMSFTEVSGTEGNHKWPRQLDLNTGPGSFDLEAREDRVVSRQFSIGNCQVSLEEQARAYHQAAALGGIPLKRKEPEGGWDSHRIGYKQPSWQ